MGMEKTKQIDIEKSVYDNLAAKAEEKGMTPDEYATQLVHKKIFREKFTRINIVVPKCLLRLMKDKHFFGSTEEAFLITCIQRGIDCEFSDMERSKWEPLEKEYKTRIDWAHLWQSINC